MKTITQYIRDECEALVVVNERYIPVLSKLSFIAIVGSTCSGKTTLVNSIRNLSPVVCVPKRYITRPRRIGDDTVENVFVTKQEFSNLVAREEIELYWTRWFSYDRSEQYGFQPFSHSFSVLSGNNALIKNGDSVTPHSILKGRTLFIEVYAPKTVREARLVKRSPDLMRNKPEEVSFRLLDTLDSFRHTIPLRMNNYEAFEAYSVPEFQSFVEYCLVNIVSAH